MEKETINKFKQGIIAGIFAAIVLSIYVPLKEYELFVLLGSWIFLYEFPFQLFIGLIYGFLFALLYNAIPGSNSIKKGISFSLIFWAPLFISSISTWIRENLEQTIFAVPLKIFIHAWIQKLIFFLILGIVIAYFYHKIEQKKWAEKLTFKNIMPKRWEKKTTKN